MWPFHRLPGQTEDLHTSHLEFAEGQSRERLNAIGRSLRWESALILGALAALVAVSIGSVAWRALT